MGSFFQWARVFFKEPPSLTPQDEGKPTSINHQYKSKKWIAKAYLLISLSVVLKLNRSLGRSLWYFAAFFWTGQTMVYK